MVRVVAMIIIAMTVFIIKCVGDEPPPGGLSNITHLVCWMINQIIIHFQTDIIESLDKLHYHKSSKMHILSKSSRL